MPESTQPLIRCVGGIVRDGRGRLLLVQRGHEPAAGLWSLPGGRVEAGEADEDAVVREVAEETGVRVQVLRYVGSVQRPAPGGGTYDIRDFLASASGVQQPRAGDDAVDAMWATRADLAALPLVDSLMAALTGWSMLPRI